MDCGRKRTHSITSTINNNNNNNKRKKRAFTAFKRTFIPPTKFLLGGNIRDPLNLCGLQNEEEPDKEPVDSSYSPYTDFLLGGDINDPLNLKGIKDNEGTNIVTQDSSVNETNNSYFESTSSYKFEQVVAANGDTTNEKKKSDPLEHVNISNCKKIDRRDKIVSPVIPQPYRPLKNIHFNKHQIITPNVAGKEQKTPRFKEKNHQFQYGNYNRYYGYRNNNHGLDLRLEILTSHKDLFNDKDILDLGCNIGHIALIIARDFNAKSVTGMDIDRSLIDIAKKNIKYYVNCTSPYGNETPRQFPTAEIRKLNLKNKCYPVSMPILYGAVNENNFNKSKTFPKNVSFVQGNYVLESDSLLQLEQPQFDTILCLSMTKWIHLNWGDDGLKRAFKRMFLSLKPGGALIIEPQSWDSYNKKKTLTEVIWKNYHSIQLFPHHFDQYLLSSEVGFSRCQTIAVVNHQQKGFRRPLKMFIKPVPIACNKSDVCLKTTI